MHTSQVPELVRRRALQSAAGTRWLEDLPAMLDELGMRWCVTIEQVLSGGSEALVCIVLNEARHRHVLKCPMPLDSPSHELEVLRLAQGRGYANLMQCQEHPWRAWMVEHLGASLEAGAYSPRQQLEILCDCLISCWITLPSPPSARGFVSGDVKARDLGLWIDEGRHTLVSHVSTHTIDVSLNYVLERGHAHDPDEAILAHGDPHPGNVLHVPDTVPAQFKMIDPDGLFIERAYDLGVILREWNASQLAHTPLETMLRWCEWLGERAQCDPEAIWQWAMIERVSTALALIGLGMEHEAISMLQVAEVCAARCP